MRVLVEIDELVLERLNEIGRDQALCVLRLRGRRHGRNYVVKEAVVFVVVDEQDGLAPDVGVGGEGFQDAVYVVGSVAG